MVVAPWVVLAVRVVFRLPYFHTWVMGSNSMFLLERRGRVICGMSPLSRASYIPSATSVRRSIATFCLSFIFLRLLLELLFLQFLLLLFLG